MPSSRRRSARPARSSRSTDGDSTKDGVYLFKVRAEETRTPEGSQLDELKSSAFSTWYIAQEGGRHIVRDETITGVAS